MFPIKKLELKSIENEISTVLKNYLTSAEYESFNVKTKLYT